MNYDYKTAALSLAILLVGTFIIVSINASNSHSLNIAWENIFLFLTPIFSFICFFPVILVDKIITPIKERRERLK